MDIKSLSVMSRKEKSGKVRAKTTQEVRKDRAVRLSEPRKLWQNRPHRLPDMWQTL
jgi:hypothetical protein